MARVAKKGRYLYRAYRRLRLLRLGLLFLALLLALAGLKEPLFLLFIPLPLFAFGRIHKKKRILKSGLEGERITERRLRELPASFDIYSDLTFNGSQIDHLVVGKSVVFVIETKHLRGRLSGHGSEAQWLLEKKEGHRRKVYNPMKQVGTHAKQVRLGLGDRSIPVVPILHLTHPQGRLLVKSPTTLFVEDHKDPAGLIQRILRLDQERPALSSRKKALLKERFKEGI